MQQNIKVYHVTFANSHLVSSIETKRLHKAWETVGIKVVSNIEEADFVVIKGFSSPDNFDFQSIKIPIILHSYGIQWRKGIDLIVSNKKYWEEFSHADGVVNMSEFSQSLVSNALHHKLGINDDSIERMLRRANKKLAVIPNSVQGYPSFRKMDIIADKLILATTAVWRDWKRLNQLIDYVLRWNQDPFNTAIDLWIGGSVADSNKIGDDRIHYVGQINSFPPSHYSMMHGYIHLALMETFGNTVAEALALQLPCIVTNLGAPKELVKNAGVIIESEPKELLDFSERPTMYGGMVPGVGYNNFQKALKDYIENYELYFNNALLRSIKFSPRVVGKLWLDYFLSFNK